MTNGNVMDPTKDSPGNPQTTRELTLGEKRVRSNFNPSENSVVDRIKQKSAELIDLVQMVKNDAAVNPNLDNQEQGEIFRLVALAQTAYEEGAMWGVKAATF